MISYLIFVLDCLHFIGIMLDICILDIFMHAHIVFIGVHHLFEEVVDFACFVGIVVVVVAVRGKQQPVVGNRSAGQASLDDRQTDKQKQPAGETEAASW